MLKINVLIKDLPNSEFPKLLCLRMFISSLVLVLYRHQIAFPDVDLLEEDFLLNIWHEDNFKVV
jgi:hypothetical protein